MSGATKILVRGRGPVALVGMGISLQHDGEGMSPSVHSLKLVHHDGRWYAQLELEVEPDVEIDSDGTSQRLRLTSPDGSIEQTTLEVDGEPLPPRLAYSLEFKAGELIVIRGDEALLSVTAP